MATDPVQDRRSQPRFAPQALSALLRLKGELGRISVAVLDFNRHGVAIQCDRPLPKEAHVYLSLDDGVTQLERVIGVVHNCLTFDGGYRCGIRFRPQSKLQFDREVVEARLAELEDRFSAACAEDVSL